MRTLANLAGFARGRADRLFGYDFFISYAHDDGADYPRELAKRLRERQFTVFLDEEVYVGGTDLPSATRRRVRMSNKLVVVGRPHVLTSTWVLKEVDESLAAEREPIVIDVDGSWAAADGANPLKQRIGERIYLTEEPPGAVLPSPRVVDDLARSYDATRKEIVRRYTLTAALAAFLVILFIAAWQLREARLQSRTAAATRAENLFRAMSLAGREDDFEPEPLLLACRAVAAAPRGDPRLPAYSLHAFYEGLKQPIGVAQLPRRVQWSVFRP
ncbi:MAG TPA: toll/interleukin-1 receptor domain-containing protein, partial [Thermoanaerobaculia bacterium]|nr:toll/interleukin-1 receptor domain-containing protein [Thermoanaerobaculia bacterium]